MSRPRIRSLKPELWQDEKIGRLSRDARLLFIGLVTMADDEGRLRALTALILGHVFPYDGDAPKRIVGWLEEIADSGLIHRYVVDGIPYVQIIGWRKHQVINRPTPSELPHGPLTEPSVNGPVPVGDGSVPRARACAGADRKGREGKGPPLPPSGGRQRDQDRFAEEMESWAVEAIPDLSPRAVVWGVNMLRAANVPEGEITPARIRERAEQMHPALLGETAA